MKATWKHMKANWKRMKAEWKQHESKWKQNGAKWKTLCQIPSAKWPGGFLLRLTVLTYPQKMKILLFISGGLLLWCYHYTGYDSAQGQALTCLFSRIPSFGCSPMAQIDLKLEPNKLLPQALRLYKIIQRTCARQKRTPHSQTTSTLQFLSPCNNTALILVPALWRPWKMVRWCGWRILDILLITGTYLLLQRDT